MPRRRALLAALVVLGVGAPAAWADPPWTVPAVVPGAFSAPGGVVFTAAGHGLIAGPALDSLAEHPTLVTPLDAAGRMGTGRPVAIFAGRLVTYGADGLALIGTRAAQTSAQADAAPVLVATGKGATGAFGTPRALPGTAGQQVLAVAGSARGTIALVTGTGSGPRERIVWAGAGGATLRRVLTIHVGTQARGASVAVGSHGDLLVAYEDAHTIFSRHVGPTGHTAAAHKLGAGVQSELQTRYDDSGRQEVAWMRQRVDEGDAVTGATVSYTSAAKGHNFTKARIVGRDDITGAGRYVQLPGVRLVGSGSDSSVLATTIYTGGHYRVEVAGLAGGTVQPASVMPTGDGDVVLGDLAYSRAGGTEVLWLSDTRGTDPTGPQQVFGDVRPAGAATFGPAEAISAAGVPYPPQAAVDPVSGTAAAVYGTVAGQALESVRPVAAP